MNSSRPISTGPEFESLVGQRIHRGRVCQILGIDPVLGERELVSWVQFDDARGVGINAMLATYTADDGEPFDGALAVYESSRCDSGKGIDSQCVALLDFVQDQGDPEIWVVQHAETPDSWHEESVSEALRQIQNVLNDWPMQREAR